MSTNGKTMTKKKKAKKWRNAEEELYSYAAKGKVELLAAVLGLPYENDDSPPAAAPTDTTTQSPLGEASPIKLRAEPVTTVDPREINPNWHNSAHKGMTALMAAAAVGRP